MGAIAYPIGWLIVEGILWGAAVVGGADVSSLIAKEIADYIDDELSQTISTARECQNSDCLDCDPPVGTVGYRIDWVPPSTPHPPCLYSHVQFYIRRQFPARGLCVWKKQRRVLSLSAGLGPDDFDPSDLGDGAIPIPQTPGR